MELSEKERITLLMMRGWGDRQRSYREVRELFNEFFSDRTYPISKSTVARTIQRFEEIGVTKNRPVAGRPKISTDDKNQMTIAQAFVENPCSSIRAVSKEQGICRSSVHRVLKCMKFHPYKVHLVQELNDDDPDRRMEFCEKIMSRIDRDKNFLANIVFSDEAQFTIDGEINRHNCRYWTDINPCWMIDSKTQHKQSVNVWAGILNNTIIGPYFIDGNLNAQKYESLLKEHIVPKVRQLAEHHTGELWFQQDGATPHYAVSVRNYLNVEFRNKWIGRRGEIEWPARSPDLSPLDYFLWGHLKSKIYATKPSNLEDLRNRIIEETAQIDPNVISKAVSDFYQRIAHCQAINGSHFEHLL